ncbi:MAG: hypothetical protein II883_08920 [Spirochaetales bacterium]|nr:hypothetical protein [Spirochaetales bacterium]MBQ4501102.1 hypothetical protein [Spirochaetales bacterium]
MPKKRRPFGDYYDDFDDDFDDDDLDDDLDDDDDDDDDDDLLDNGFFYDEGYSRKQNSDEDDF